MAICSAYGLHVLVEDTFRPVLISIINVSRVVNDAAVGEQKRVDG